MPDDKVLTLAAVVEIIASARIPPGETSADEVIIDRIEGYKKAGYALAPDAQKHIQKYYLSAASPCAAQAAAE